MIYLFTEYNRITDEDLNVLLEKLPESVIFCFFMVSEIYINKTVSRISLQRKTENRILMNTLKYILI